MSKNTLFGWVTETFFKNTAETGGSGSCTVFSAPKMIGGAPAPGEIPVVIGDARVYRLQFIPISKPKPKRKKTR